MGGRAKAVTFSDKASLMKRLERDKLIDGEHWIWTGYCDRGGYGAVTIDGRSYTVSRVAAFIWLGLNIEDRTIEAKHKPICEVRSCFNPSHLSLGSHLDNMRDVSDKAQSNPNYPCGHPRIAENTMPDKRGYKSCRACHNSISLNAYYIKKVHTELEAQQTK